jgi:acyl-CoA reductase-like NAD-dependent aldehyde dehydrogenase
MCTSTERVYVQSKVAPEFIAKVKAIASQYKIGPWHDENTHLGPIINERQLSKIDFHVKDALSKGANLLLGGQILDGRYYEPTVITGMKPDMQMESNETFGPIVAISEFESIEEAISRANNSIYGLGAVVFGQANARAVANQLEAGMIGINKGPGGSGDSPWVGAKQSGYGFHGSQEGHRLFAQVTVVE